MLDEIIADLPSWLRSNMESYGLTNKAVGFYLGVHVNTVCNWRCGRKEPSATHLALLLRLFGYELER